MKRFLIKQCLAMPSMTMRFAAMLLISICASLVATSAMPMTATAQDELKPTASWENPDIEDVRRAVQGWLDQTKPGEDLARQSLEILGRASDSFQPTNALQLVLDTMIVSRPDLQPIRELITSSEKANQAEMPNFASVLDNKEESAFVKHHVRLIYSRWLVQNHLYDEGLAELEQLQPEQVLDPASLLFYKSLAQHQLLRKDECLETVDRLLENEEQLPKRFAIVGKLMAADIEPMKTDSLDEIARMMSDIRRRQSLFRAGTRVRTEEEEVIKKLDKVIEKIEAAQQAAQQQQQPGAPSPDSKPMEDSQIAGGKGDGKVPNKKLDDGGDWGDLPPAERAAAMAEMAKDLPPHYRSVIEEYFRKLAEEKKR